MRIVHQSAANSYSHFPPPQLLLAAPRIAGLLPARCATGQAEAQPTFTYQNARLAEMPTYERERFLSVTCKLLDVAVAFALGDMNEQTLRAAEALFHQTLTGHAPPRARTPDAWRAERDASLLDWLLEVNGGHQPDAYSAGGLQ